MDDEPETVLIGSGLPRGYTLYVLALPRFLRIESPRISIAVCVVNQSVEDAVSQRGIADLFMALRIWAWLMGSRSNRSRRRRACEPTALNSN